MENNSNHTTNSEFTCNRVRLSPEEQIGLHQQHSWELSLVITGVGMRLIGNHSEPFSAGEVVLIPPDIPHCWYFDKEQTDAQGKIENISLSITPTWLEKCKNLFPELGPAVERVKSHTQAIKLDGDKSARMARLMREASRQNETERTATFLLILMELSNLGQQRVVGGKKSANREQERLKQIEIYTTCNLRRKITLSAVARHVGMNRSAFCIFFKRATGQSYITYLNTYRIEMAGQLLKAGKMPVGDISAQVGFNNVSYFNRLFKKLKGVCPGQFSKPSTR